MMHGRSIMLGVATALGLGGVANGTVMLLDPVNWYSPSRASLRRERSTSTLSAISD